MKRKQNDAAVGVKEKEKVPTKKKERENTGPKKAQPQSEVAFIDQEELMRSLHFSTMKTADDVCEELKDGSHKGNVEFDPEVISRVTSLLWDAVTVDWTTDLEEFSSHARRSTINAEDVRLLMRRNSHLREVVEGCSGVSVPASRKSSGRKSISKNKEPSLNNLPAEPTPGPSRPDPPTTPVTSYIEAAPLSGITPLPPNAHSTPIRSTPAGGRKLPIKRMPSPIDEIDEFVGFGEEDFVNSKTFSRDRPTYDKSNEQDKLLEDRLNQEAARKLQEHDEQDALDWERELNMKSMVDPSHETAPLAPDTFDSNIGVPEPNRSPPNSSNSVDMFDEIPETPPPLDSFDDDATVCENQKKPDKSLVGERTLMQEMGFDVTPLKPKSESFQRNTVHISDSFDSDIEEIPIEEENKVPTKTNSFDDLQLIEDVLPKKSNQKTALKSLNPFKKADTSRQTLEKTLSPAPPESKKSKTEFNDSFEDDFIVTPRRPKSRSTPRSNERSKEKKTPETRTDSRDSFFDDDDYDFDLPLPKPSKPSMFAKKNDDGRGSPVTPRSSTISSKLPNFTPILPSTSSTTPLLSNFNNLMASNSNNSLGNTSNASKFGTKFSAFSFDCETQSQKMKATKPFSFVKESAPETSKPPNVEEEDSFDFDDL